jgi:uncharacterized membrane protein
MTLETMIAGFFLTIISVGVIVCIVRTIWVIFDD